MPARVKRRKRRADPMSQAQAWSMAFRSGYDFLGDLADHGLTEDAAVRAAMREAWQQYGALFLEHFDEPDTGPAWAMEQYGPPDAN